MCPSELPKMPPGLGSVPAFPAVALKLLPLFANNGSSAAVIAACVSKDPAISGRLIKRANYADQACAFEVKSVLQAVLNLGVDRTREITLEIAMAVHAHSVAPSESSRYCFHHTLASALAASEVALQCGLRPDEAHTAALLHDIGLLGLLHLYPNEYENILAAPESEPGDFLRMERACFGVDHVEAGMWLGRQWYLPKSIIDVIARHHDEPSGELDLATVVQVASRLADLLGFGVSRTSSLDTFEQISAALPARIRKPLRSRLRALQAEIVTEITFFEGKDAPPLEIVEFGSDEVEPEETSPAGPSFACLPPSATRSRLPFGVLMAVLTLVIASVALFILRARV